MSFFYFFVDKDIDNMVIDKDVIIHLIASFI